MSHEIEPRRSDAYSMTPLISSKILVAVFDGFKANMIKTDIHENDSEYLSLKQSCLVFLKKIFKSLMRMSILTISWSTSIGYYD